MCLYLGIVMFISIAPNEAFKGGGGGWGGGWGWGWREPMVGLMEDPSCLICFRWKCGSGLGSLGQYTLGVWEPVIGHLVLWLWQPNSQTLPWKPGQQVAKAIKNFLNMCSCDILITWLNDCLDLNNKECPQESLSSSLIMPDWFGDCVRSWTRSTGIVIQTRSGILYFHLQSQIFMAQFGDIYWQ